MVENTLDVRLLHAAKSLSDWNNVTTKPKLGEVCLEIQGTTPPLSYKIKIGDGSSTYAQLPYFGSVISTSGNASVVAVDTVTSGGVSKKVLKFYKLTLSATTTDGTTTITPSLGDLILTIQEGNGINFSTNSSDDVLSVLLEPTTEGTAVTLSDEGTFTAVTVDSNNRAVKRTTFTLPSIAGTISNAINRLDVTDSTVLTAEWDSTNSQIKFYYTKETDGLVQRGSLAYTINAIDIAPVQNVGAGNKIDVSTNGAGDFRVAHESTTRTDTTGSTLSFGGSVITGVTTDSTGHITGVETSNLPSNPVDENTVTSENNLPNNEIVLGAGNKGVKTSGKTITTTAPSSTSDDTTIPTSNAVNTAINDKIETLDSSVSADTNKVLTGVTEADGVLTSKTDVSYTDIAPVQDVTSSDSGNSGIEVIINSNTADVHHKAVTQSNTTDTTPETVVDLIKNVTVDSYGHVTGKETISSDKIIAADIKAPVVLKDNSMWNHRITGGDITIGEDTAKINPLKGNTLVWNQLVDNTTSSVPTTSAHKYLTIVNGTKSIVTSSGSAISVSGGSDCVFDLTLMFGAGNEPSTVEEFEAMFPLPYYKFNKGELVSLNATGLRTTDVNNNVLSTLDFTWIKYLKDYDNNQLFHNGLLRAGSVYDEVGENYAIKRVGVVDLGSLTYDKHASQGTNDYNYFFTSSLSASIVATDDASQVANIICDGFMAATGMVVQFTQVEKTTGVKSTTVYFFDPEYSDYSVSDFRAAVSGVTFYYELAEPITVYFDKKNFNYPVDDLGTETLLPEGVNSTTGTPLSAPFCGQFEYKSKFKDAVIDLIDTVNSYKNPVRGLQDTNQTVGELAVYDSNSTTHSSGFKASNRTIVITNIDNNVVLPTTEALIEYVQNIASAALHYKGTVATEDILPDYPSIGDLYIASAQIVADGTNVLPAGTYDAGDFFIWNGIRWDVIQGTVRVSNNNPTLTLNGSTHTVGTVEGINLQVTTPDLQASDPTASGSGLEFIATASQTNGQISVTKQTVQDGTTSQKGVVQLNSSYNRTETDKAATGASITNAIEGLDVSTDKGAATISGNVITIKGVQQEDGLIKDGGTTTINLDGSYDASNNKLATQSTVTDAVEALDVDAVTINGNEHITSISETDGKIAVTKATIQDATTAQKGIVQFVTDIHNSTETTKVASAKQTWDEFEKRNVQFVESSEVPEFIPITNEETFLANHTYGIAWTQNSNDVTLVGHSTLISAMPIHNSLKACVNRIVPVSGGFDVSEVIDGVSYTVHYGARREFLYWLNRDMWTLKEDGSPSVLTGEDMTNISIYHCKFYGKSFNGIASSTDHTHSGNVNEVRISQLKYDDTWTEIKEGYVDFAKMQSVATSGVTYARSFGNPDFSVTNPMENEMTLADINTWIQKQKGSSIALTKSQVALNRVTSHQYALNSGAHIMSFDEYKWIFCWLPAIECAAFTVENNSYFDWQDGASTNIVSRDSLSSVPSFMYYGLYSDNYSAITSALGWPCIPAGYTNVLGTHTGWVKMRLPNSSGGYDSKIVSRWRGFEIQRNIWTNLMGVNPVQTKTSGITDVYTTKNRALWNNNMPINITDSSSATHDNIVPWNSRNTTTPEYTTLTGWEHAGIQAWTGNGREFDLGSEANPTYNATGSVKPDYSSGYMNNANPRWFIAGGYLAGAGTGGPFCFSSDSPAGSAYGDVGFRCCWNVDEYTSVMN